jgi:hypothetical protein
LYYWVDLNIPPEVVPALPVFLFKLPGQAKPIPDRQIPVVYHQFNNVKV